ncbi:hypothetical protein RRG08_002693 [Elysia crispata]|uniref:Uncharacterized protein n=1 Tax=Elysia crispata TaxID=231223 RepID=A0AAE0XU81_9GAST|nr:hypothetical protein RRG08_002693 [Elysia crispata]
MFVRFMGRDFACDALHTMDQWVGSEKLRKDWRGESAALGQSSAIIENGVPKNCLRVTPVGVPVFPRLPPCLYARHGQADEDWEGRVVYGISTWSVFCLTTSGVRTGRDEWPTEYQHG